MSLPPRALARILALAIGTALAFAAQAPVPAYAASGDINAVIDSARLWIFGILAGLSMLFITIGAAKYLVASGNPHAMEEAKETVKSALIGFGVAALAPLLVDIIRRVLGI
jgi:hypothetical protein